MHYVNLIASAYYGVAAILAEPCWLYAYTFPNATTYQLVQCSIAKLNLSVSLEV